MVFACILRKQYNTLFCQGEQSLPIKILYADNDIEIYGRYDCNCNHFNEYNEHRYNCQQGNNKTFAYKDAYSLIWLNIYLAKDDCIKKKNEEGTKSNDK